MKTTKPKIDNHGRQQNPGRQSESADFNEVVSLLAIFSEATSRLLQIEARASRALLEVIGGHRDEYAALQAACKKSETALECLCRSHPEWFTAARTLKTPYGRVGFRNVASLAVRDDEATVKLLRAEHERTLARHDADGTTGIFPANDYLRMIELPNLEALEKLDDETLKKFMITRVQADSFSVTAATVNFNKAVKETAAKRN